MGKRDRTQELERFAMKQQWHMPPPDWRTCFKFTIHNPPPKGFVPYPSLWQRIRSWFRRVFTPPAQKGEDQR